MAVFKSARQALHVAFLMESLPAMQKSQMQAMIEMLMRERGIVEPMHDRERSVDFSGLSPLEIRGQCAMVIAATTSHLTSPEIAAVTCRYGLGRRQSVAIRGLSEYVAPQLSTGSIWPIMAMAWGLFIDKKRKHDFTLRAISEEYGLAVATLGRDQKQIRKTHHSLEELAFTKLDDYFKRTELVEDAVSA